MLLHLIVSIFPPLFFFSSVCNFRKTIQLFKFWQNLPSARAFKRLCSQMRKFVGKLDTPSMNSQSWFPLPWSLKSTLTHRTEDLFSSGRRLIERNVTEMTWPYKLITSFTFACRIKMEFPVSQVKDFMSFCSFWCRAECLDSCYCLLLEIQAVTLETAKSQ